MKPDRASLEDIAALAPSETTPLWMEVARRQAARRPLAGLLDQFASDLFVAPSPLDLRLANHLDALALEAARDFEALLLSPVAPLAACSALAPTSQDRTLTAARGVEVVSDPTNVLALECARRLRKSPNVDVRLCTVHQTLRAQPQPKRSGFTRHFRLFALAEAGPGLPEDGFEVSAIVRHVGVFNRLFDAAAQVGARFPARRGTILVSDDRRTLGERARRALGSALPGVPFETAPLDAGYYGGVRVMFGADTVSGEFCPIGDLGVFDWVARLAANRRQRFVASGLGLQLVPFLFAKATSAASAGA
jgi:hypothetical protein